jgi:hypothetical protein
VSIQQEEVQRLVSIQKEVGISIQSMLNVLNFSDGREQQKERGSEKDEELSRRHRKR